jgi:cell division protease FtsH
MTNDRMGGAMNEQNNEAPSGNQQNESWLDKTPLWSRVFLVVLLGSAISYFYAWYATSTQVEVISYSTFKSKIAQGEIGAVDIRGKTVRGQYTEKKEQEKGEEQGSPAQSSSFQTILPPFEDPELLPLLEKHQVTLKAEKEEQSAFWSILLTLLPVALIIGFFVYLNRNIRSRIGEAAGGMFNFGKSKARLYTKTQEEITFEDVAGLEHAKHEFAEIVDFLRHPGKYRALGAEMPKGILLVGPPGTGKTLMARAMAGEADVPFFSISGSEFIEMFVGVGASRVRDMFDKAKKDSPAIIFIDEIDSIGRVRGTGLGGGHDEREQTLNQILSEMDGFSAKEPVIVLAATNRPDVLDPALVRPGRFDRQITLDLPQREARQKILELHAKDKPVAKDVDFASLAGRTVGFSGADLKNLVNEAALLAASKGEKEIEAEDFDNGRDKIILGLEREERMTDEEKKMVAFHEAGHTLTALKLPGADPIKKVTIIPRGGSLGATEQLPPEDRHNLGRKYLLNRITVMLGGHAAEKLIYQDVTSGAGDDLKKATELARRMVCNWGMNETLGPVAFRMGEPHPFLGRELTQTKDFSEDTARRIDEEIFKIMNDCQGRATEILGQNRQQLDALAQALYEKETLMEPEILAIVKKVEGSAD